MKITKELLKIFVDWTKLKIRIHVSERMPAFPKKKEIWWVSLGQNIGVEANGKNATFERPVLVIKVFNTYSYLVAPISSKVREDKYLFEFINNADESNIVNISQLRTISAKRFVRKVADMTDSDFDQIIELIRVIILTKTEAPFGASSELLGQEQNVTTV